MMFNLQFILKFVLILAMQNVVKTEFYSSVHQMSKIVELESQTVKLLERFTLENEQKLEYLKGRLAEMERERNAALKMGADLYYDNPVNKYLLLKRLTVDWDGLENIMHIKTGSSSLKKFQALTDTKSLPVADEYLGALEGLLRLQDIYRLKTSNIAAGLLADVQYDTQLDAATCYEIGLHAAGLELLRIAHAWLEEAHKRVTREPKGSRAIDEAQVLFEFARIKAKLRDLNGANATLKRVLELRPHSEHYAKGYVEFLKETENMESQELDYSDEHEPLPEEIPLKEYHLRYKLTCSGHLQPTPSEVRYLQCYYLHQTHAFLRLAPFKVEELSLDPVMVVFYDVISDREIKLIKELTANKYARAKVYSNETSIVSKLRTSQYTTLEKYGHPIMVTLERRIGHMTGLNMKYSEYPQFANYGIGGHYSEHYDWFSKATFDAQQVLQAEMGNRIATVLFYMSEVEQGGGTAFPYLKRLIKPVKGSAAFWFNLHASGQPDLRTLHGACPIIVGSKWIHNRWIREHDQSDRRPCELWDDSIYPADKQIL